MPILNVELVTESIPDGLARRIADESARALQTGPGRTWVRLRRLDPKHYAENGVSETPRAVFVTVLKADLPADLGPLASELAHAIAAASETRSDLVHIVFEPPARGRVAFGGVLRT